ncbi:hypothetical protein ACFPN7_16200 [Amycolatopsis halotolerans]|uniref:hypothetical protein n=1 Tax=Amycolatopsis halotolerans TaxID=330083 RepID=UPI00361E0601
MLSICNADVGDAFELRFLQAARRQGPAVRSGRRDAAIVGRVAHDGVLTVYNADEGGAVFELCFPKAASRPNREAGYGCHGSAFLRLVADAHSCAALNSVSTKQRDGRARGSAVTARR